MFLHLHDRKVLRMAEGGGTGGDAGGAGGGEKPWFDGLDTETKGYLQNRGWDKKTAPEAFFEASKAHREAEKFVGAPANEVVRLPKDPASPEWQQVHARLGKPSDAKDYDFSAVKRSDGKVLSEVDKALEDTIRQAAFDINLNKENAQRLASSIVKHLDGIEAAKLAEATDKLGQEKAELKKNWGGNEAANMVVAQAAAKALGISPEGVAALEKVVGYAKVMEMFRVIGTKIGEDRFVTSNTTGGGNGIMTRDQAVAEKNALKSDGAWVKRYLAGGHEEKRKMEALDRIISGVA